MSLTIIAAIGATTAKPADAATMARNLTSPVITATSPKTIANTTPIVRSVLTTVSSIFFFAFLTPLEE